MHPGLTKSFIAGGAIARRRILKFSAAGTVVQASAAADKLFGVSDMSADVASGRRVDVRLTGVAEIDVGGNITRGDQITADANGKAVTAAPGAGVNNRVVGVAVDSYVAGDIGDFFLSHGSVQG